MAKKKSANDADLEKLEKLLDKLIEKKISDIVELTIRELEKREPRLRHERNPFSV